MMQEVWITIRLKGEMRAAFDAQNLALRVLQHAEQTFLDKDMGFTVCQPGDVIEVEEEAQIYNHV